MKKKEDNEEGKVVLTDGPIEPPVKTPAPDVKKEEPKKESLPIVAVSGNDSDYYQVKEGDTLWNISRRFKITIAELVKWNNLKNNTIKLGMKLKVNGKI